MYSNKWPLRQDDDEWRDEIMWNREIVIETHMEGNCASREEAKNLLREFDKGNTIEHEGCLLTSLSMVLQLLGRKKWTPELLNREAHECLYYTPAGLSMVPLYADIVSEVSKGEIQLCAKEEYLPGEDGWEPNFPSTSWLVRAYRELPESDRCNFVVMLKTGTYDDSVASHYLLLDPDDPGKPDEDNARVLDPAMSMGRKRAWRLSDSATILCRDGIIKDKWDEANIQPTQIAGVWLFARWRTKRAPMLLEPIIAILADKLSKKA